MKRNTDVEAPIVAKFVVMAPVLDERARRLWAAAESVAIGDGGDAGDGTPLHPRTIVRGLVEANRRGHQNSFETFDTKTVDP